MNDFFTFKQGESPLLVSSPHSGTEVPDAIADRFTEDAWNLHDTDWHIPALYDFVSDFSASTIEARYSRYVVDLNRPPDNSSLYPGQATTGLCPVQMFDGEPIYKAGQEPGPDEVAERTRRYWQPYHSKIAEELSRIRSKYGYALLYDCHSIRSVIPRLFDGRLPTLNLGTSKGTSCDSSLEKAIADAMKHGDYDCVVNGRFVGGHITRHFGDPNQQTHAVQMELTQIDYMDETLPYTYQPERADRLKKTLKDIMLAFTNVAEKLHR